MLIEFDVNHEISARYAIHGTEKRTTKKSKIISQVVLNVWCQTQRDSCQKLSIALPIIYVSKYFSFFTEKKQQALRSFVDMYLPASLHTSRLLAFCVCVRARIKLYKSKSKQAMPDTITPFFCFFFVHNCKQEFDHCKYTKNGLIFQEQTCSRDKKLLSPKKIQTKNKITESESKRE